MGTAATRLIALRGGNFPRRGTVDFALKEEIQRRSHRRDRGQLADVRPTWRDCGTHDVGTQQQLQRKR